jgi:cell division protein FtsI (penicillin-binding protein 3)
MSDDRPDPGFEQRWRSGVKRRTLVLLAVIACWVAGLEARLVQLQVFLHDEYSAIAEAQQLSIINIAAPRGDITDREGRLLAYSVEAEAIMAVPHLIADARETVTALCLALGDCTASERTDLIKRLSRDGRYVSVRRARALTTPQAQRVRDLKLEGINLEADVRRYYPGSQIAAHVIGYTGQDDVGLAGIEHTYDTQLRGQPGRGTALVDGRRDRLATRVVREPVAGASLELTIDADLQHVVERELAAGVKANRARAGTAVVMNPMTGEILALANYPTYDPNDYGSYSQQARRNRAVQDVYEPGSTFKIVTASAAIQDGVIAPDDLIDTSPGSLKVPGRRKLITDTHDYGVLSFRDAIVKSSNIGAVKAGHRVGAERIGRYVHQFGFGQTLAPDLAGESRGIWSSKLTESGLASVSMGYQVSVTALQMAAAASAVANGGLLLQPHLVRAVIRDGQRAPVAPRVIRRAITVETAATLRAMMEQVIERGTGTRAQVAGYRVAGKTGTSNRAIPGGYSSVDYNASLVGFAPAGAPAFTILVVIDSPKAGSHYGGTVAGPIFQKIAEAALVQAGLPRDVDPEAPVLIRANAPLLTRPHTTAALMPTLTPVGGQALMPDLRGLSGREALRMLAEIGVSVRGVSGTGFVARQQPEAGSPVAPGAWSVLQLRRTGSASREGAVP